MKNSWILNFGHFLSSFVKNYQLPKSVSCSSNLKSKSNKVDCFYIVCMSSAIVYICLKTASLNGRLFIACSLQYYDLWINTGILSCDFPSLLTTARLPIVDFYDIFIRIIAIAAVNINIIELYIRIKN